MEDWFVRRGDYVGGVRRVWCVLAKCVVCLCNVCECVLNMNRSLTWNDGRKNLHDTYLHNENSGVHVLSVCVCDCVRQTVCSVVTGEIGKTDINILSVLNLGCLASIVCSTHKLRFWASFSNRAIQLQYSTTRLDRQCITTSTSNENMVHTGT